MVSASSRNPRRSSFRKILERKEIILFTIACITLFYYIFYSKSLTTSIKEPNSLQFDLPSIHNHIPPGPYSDDKTLDYFVTDTLHHDPKAFTCYYLII